MPVLKRLRRNSRSTSQRSKVVALNPDAPLMRGVFVLIKLLLGA
jgi:hypothetical protein